MDLLFRRDLPEKLTKLTERIGYFRLHITLSDVLINSANILDPIAAEVSLT
jgi:hypothetical protein